MGESITCGHCGADIPLKPADSFTTKDIRAAVEAMKANDAVQHGAGCMKDVGGDCGPACVVMIPIDGPPTQPGFHAEERTAAQVPFSMPAKIVEVAATPLDALGFAETTSIKLALGADQKGFVFTLSERARERMDLEQLRQLAMSLGALVHPASAALVVLPDGEQLSTYRVEAGQDDRAVKLLDEALRWRDGYETSTPEGQEFVARTRALLKEYGLWSEG